MGRSVSKHRAEGTKASGSIFDLFRRSSKRGRYGSEPSSAAGVLASAGRRPVLAAIAVPTAAAASIVAAGFAVTPSPEEEQSQFTQNAAPAADAPDTSAADKAAKDAEKQQKDSAPSLTVKEEEPADDAESNSSGSSGKSSGISKRSGSKSSSRGSSTAANDSNKPKNTKASGKAGSCPASTYGQGDGFHGKKTANGERFNRNAMTAAHKTLPFNSRVKVTNTRNGKSVTVRINDRGPFHSNRCLDLSTAAMKQIGGDGVAQVKWQVL